MITTKRILNTIIQYYLNSRDYKGISFENIPSKQSRKIIRLIKKGLVEVLSTSETDNPSIKCFQIHASIDDQIKEIMRNDERYCLYPTENALKSVDVKNEPVYTAKMMRGKPQHELVFFKPDIIEVYRRNPIYKDHVVGGYRGTISINPEYDNDEDDEIEYVKSYGLAYQKGAKLNRAICVFICDLAKLTRKQQMLWSYYELEHERCVPSKGFVNDLIIGSFDDDSYWVFYALLEEMSIINLQCDAIGIPHLFRETFSNDFFELPQDYEIIMLPTQKNLDRFIVVLEKIIIHNISFKPFTFQSCSTKCIDRENEEGVPKPTLTMLEEWLKLNIPKTSCDFHIEIIAPLRKLRELRQAPAHKIYDDKYDIEIFQKQIDLIISTYGAIRNIRLMFANHPYAREIPIPQRLLTGEKIRNH